MERKNSLRSTSSLRDADGFRHSFILRCSAPDLESGKGVRWGYLEAYVGVIVH
jgi:hypothetical protein